MKRNFCLMLVVLSQLFLLEHLDAQRDPDRYRLPDSVKAINSLPDLQPFLTSRNGDYRNWGVIRYGQIGSPSDIQVLLDMYNNEPFRQQEEIHGPGPGVKYFSLLAIGEIGGVEAEKILLRFADEYGYVVTMDSIYSFSAICQALGDIGSSAAAAKLEKISEDTSITYLVRQQALSSYYLCRLKGSEFSDAADSVDFLVSEMKSNFSNEIDDLENFIITKAANLTLVRINCPEVLSVLASTTAAITDNPELKLILERTYEGMSMYQNK
jgi:hypothetical protein